LFWTEAVRNSTVEADPEEGQATLDLTSEDVPEVKDFHNIPNSLAGGPGDDAFFRLHVEWDGEGAVRTVNDTTNEVAARFVNGPGSISFRATNLTTGFTYDSVRKGQTVKFAEVGRERNGVFFSHPETDD
jgi:hypothetical protein